MYSDPELVYRCGHRVDAAKIFRTQEAFPVNDNMDEIYMDLRPRATSSTALTWSDSTPIEKWELLV